MVIQMELLNDKVIKSNEFKKLQLILENLYIKKLNNSVSYEELTGTIILFVEKIMSSYLEDIEFCKEKFSCVVSDLPSDTRGIFGVVDNEIIIDKEVVDDIYHGNIISMLTIFHELCHFKINNEIMLGRVEFNLIRYLKERLLAIYCLETINLKDSNIYMETKNVYYESNYKVHSEERMSEIIAVHSLRIFLEKIGIELSEQQFQELKDKEMVNSFLFNNYLRDLRTSRRFNSYFLDFEVAFDIVIKSNPEWLKFSQLNIEYCLDDNGKVRKRTKEELEERLKTETDEDFRKYIQYLLTHVSSKRLEKSVFPLDNKKSKRL